MEVLIVNGSPHPNGNTAIGLQEVQKVLEEKGITTHWLQLGNKDVRGCIACHYCKTHGKCVFQDVVNETAPLFEKVDALLVGSPVYYGQPNATLTAYLTRLFYSTPFSKRMKVGAAVVSCRRGGASASFDVLNKFFTISQMPVVSSQYWNSLHGLKPGEVIQDEEGLQTMRILGKNMAFVMEAIQAQKEAMGFPEAEDPIFTNFIH